MGKLNIGTEKDQAVMFNSGILTMNDGYNVDISDITINQSFSPVELRTLNSIKKRALRRATLEQSASFTVQGQWTQLSKYFFSSSSPVSGGTEYSVLDGQQSAATVYITVNVDNDEGTVDGQYQYQLVNPIFTTNNVSLTTEEFGNVAVDVMCKEIKLVEDTGAANA